MHPSLLGSPSLTNAFLSSIRALSKYLSCAQSSSILQTCLLRPSVNKPVVSYKLVKRFNKPDNASIKPQILWNRGGIWLWGIPETSLCVSTFHCIPEKSDLAVYHVNTEWNLLNLFFQQGQSLPGDQKQTPNPGSSMDAQFVYDLLG